MSAPLSITLLLATVFAPAITRAEAVQVLDVMILGESRVAGEKVGEFSALCLTRLAKPCLQSRTGDTSPRWP
jgi:hypothetical protein